MRIVSAFLICLMAVCLFGCGKKSGLEGKVVDGKGKPMSGVKVVAKQVQPIKGYEQFEATTGSDGGFKFSKLFPTSAYELITYQDGINKSQSVKIETGPEGQTKILPEPVSIRFLFSKDAATATDTITGLIWAKNANILGSNMNWQQAMGTVGTLDIGGQKGWRLPNKMELEQLAKSGDLNSIGFTNVQPWYWSSNTYEFLNHFAWGVDMADGRVVDYGRYGGKGHVWPVKSGK